MDDELETLIEDCRKAALFYEKHPGLFTVDAGIDLYLVIARLAKILQGIKNDRGRTRTDA